MARDLTQKQFDAACERHGFKASLGGFLGYYDIGNGVSVSILNVGSRRRAQLAYLIKCRERYVRKGGGHDQN